MPSSDVHPIAVALPRPDDKPARGRYGAVMPVTPANGFTIIAKVKPGSAGAIRAHAAKLEKVVRETPDVLALLRLHFLRWALFDDDTRFLYIGISDSDLDHYAEDAVVVFEQAGIATVFEFLEGFPEDWRHNPTAFVKFCREHQVPSFMEYAEYPDVSAAQVVDALEVKQALTNVLDHMQ
jgi:hypothetical protein